MSESVKFPRDIFNLVLADHVTRGADAPVYEVVDRQETGLLLRLERHVAFWDGVKVRTVLETDWAAEEARVVQEEADRAAARAVRTQVLATFAPMVGRLVTAPFTARELQAWLVVVTHKLGGVGRGGELLAPGDWTP